MRLFQPHEVKYMLTKFGERKAMLPAPRWGVHKEREVRFRTYASCSFLVKPDESNMHGYVWYV